MVLNFGDEKTTERMKPFFAIGTEGSMIVRHWLVALSFKRCYTTQTFILVRQPINHSNDILPNAETQMVKDEDLMLLYKSRGDLLHGPKTHSVIIISIHL